MENELMIFQPVRVIVIGLGGIGSKLADELARYMMYEPKAPKELILVDGDVYSQSNLDRQSVLESDVGRPKAQAWAESLAQEFHKLSVRGMCGYVVPIGTKRENVVHIDKLEMEGAVTILAVDNHKTRKMFSDYFQAKVKNGVLINGGNNLTDGSIITSIRHDGEQILPAIDTFHPEIREPKDKNPGELSCAELSKVSGGTQIIWANQMVAALIGNELHCVVQGEWEQLRGRGEVYFDILSNAAAPRQRFVSGKEVKMPKETNELVTEVALPVTPLEVTKVVLGQLPQEEDEDIFVSSGKESTGKKESVTVLKKVKKAAAKSHADIKIVDERGKKK